MDNSIYAAPKVDLSVPADAARSAFYVVSRRKFAILFLCTLGLYKIYWFYKNWANYKAGERASGGADADIWPVPRAIFAVFFVHSLFRAVAAHAEAHDREVDIDVESAATALVVTLILSNLIDRFSDKMMSAGPAYGLSFGAIGLTMYLMLKAQQFINDSCGEPDAASNSGLSGANWVWIVIGSLVWLLAAVGIYAEITGIVL